MALKMRSQTYGWVCAKVCIRVKEWLRLKGAKPRQKDFKRIKNKAKQMWTQEFPINESSETTLNLLLLATGYKRSVSVSVEF